MSQRVHSDLISFSLSNVLLPSTVTWSKSAIGVTETFSQRSYIMNPSLRIVHSLTGGTDASILQSEYSLAHSRPGVEAQPRSFTCFSLVHKTLAMVSSLFKIIALTLPSLVQVLLFTSILSKVAGMGGGAVVDIVVVVIVVVDDVGVAVVDDGVVNVDGDVGVNEDMDVVENPTAVVAVAEFSTSVDGEKSADGFEGVEPVGPEAPPFEARFPDSERKF